MKALRGNPGKRRLVLDPAPLPDGEATSVGVVNIRVPPPPKHLAKTARAKWTRLAERLVKMGLLRLLDLGTFEVRRELYSTYRSCPRVIARKGRTYAHDGAIRVRPEIKIAQDCVR